MSCFGMATVSPVTSEEPEVISTSYTYVIMCTVLALTAMAAFLGNLMVIAVIIRTSKLHTITWCLLLNLASSDFLSAALLVPMVISIQPSNGGMRQHWLCTLIGFTYTVLAEASVWTLALLSIERYFAVNQPLHYHQRVTKHRAIVAVCSLWICALCWSSALLLPGYSFHRQFRMCLPMLGVAATLAFIGIGICLPFVILCCMYISIGRTAFTQAQRKVIECNEDNCRYVAPKHKDYRAVKILALLAGVFATCWLPLNILTVIDLFKPDNLQCSLCQLSLALTLMNAAINPWLYSILNRTFRTAACKQYKNIRDSIRVFCYCDDNKVRPPSDMELKRGDFGRQRDQMSQSQIKQEDLETKRVPLLPNQVSEPQITVSTSSQMQKSLSTPVTRNKTI
ncbi:adenosine receptor A1-like [Apostichopus japonicus]|uniref:adenosine receptor A1-like n=1 Tax=Stichopus japonicus TaxID=307972 RepID=UPI003AB26DFA